jgi:hypothetical protein
MIVQEIGRPKEKYVNIFFELVAVMMFASLEQLCIMTGILIYSDIVYHWNSNYTIWFASFISEE